MKQWKNWALNVYKTQYSLEWVKIMLKALSDGSPGTAWAHILLSPLLLISSGHTLISGLLLEHAEDHCLRLSVFSVPSLPLPRTLLPWPNHVTCFLTSFTSQFQWKWGLSPALYKLHTSTPHPTLCPDLHSLGPLSRLCGTHYHLTHYYIFLKFHL